MKTTRIFWILGLLAGPNLLAADSSSPPPPVYTGSAPAAATPVAAGSQAPVASDAVPPPTAPTGRSKADLEKLAMPIALHPDPLIAIMLPAAVYPVEIVQAARFVKNTNNIAKVDQQPWDDKVKQVAKFPDLIAKMDMDLQWTVELGRAFVEQPMDLMNAIQDLRAKAQQTGALKSTPQQVVTVTNTVVERTYQNQVVYVTNTVVQVEPASKEVVYVPSYNPSVVYVDDDDDEAAAAVISFGVGMMFGAAIWGDCDWHYGGCYWGHYPPPPPPYPPPYHPPPGAPPPRPAGRPPGTPPPANRPGTAPATTAVNSQRWQPDQGRLSTAGAPSAATRDARGWGGASTQPSQRPATANSALRPSQSPATGAGGIRAAQQPTSIPSQRPSAGTQPTRTDSSARPSTSPSIDRASPQRSSSAFSGVSSGQSARSFSSRGTASRGGGGARGGGRGR